MNDMTWWQFAGTILVVVGGLGTWMRMTIKDAIGRLEKRMDQRFDAVDGRFEARFDGVDIRFAGIEKRLSNLEEGQRILFAHLIGTNPPN